MDDLTHYMRATSRLRGQFAVAGDALREIRSISGRFMTRGHSGFEYEEISEALAVALQELSLIRSKAESALDEERS